MEKCGVLHYVGGDPENGPAEECVLEKGHDGRHMSKEVRRHAREDQLFVVSRVSRSDIAISINNAAGWDLYTDDDEQEKWGDLDEDQHVRRGTAGPLALDDERLTDEVCAKYASDLGDVQADTGSLWSEEERLSALDKRWAIELGLLLADEHDEYDEYSEHSADDEDDEQEEIE